MFYFVFYHLTRFEYLKKYKNIFRCEEILKVISLNTHRFSEKSTEKVVFHRFYQTCLIIFGGEIGGEIGEKIGRFLIRKIGGVTPHRFSCHTYQFFLKNRPTTTDFSIFVCLWKSVRKIVWWELGFTIQIIQSATLPTFLSYEEPLHFGNYPQEKLYLDNYHYENNALGSRH